MNSNSSQSQWANSPVANLVRYVPSGIYFARARVSGKLIRRSLKTDVLTVAQLRLSDLLKAERQAVESRASVSRGKMTFGDALGIYGSRLEAKVELKPSAKLYRQKCIEALVRSWPGLREMDVRKVSERECMNWAARFGAKYSALGLQQHRRYVAPCSGYLDRRGGALRQSGHDCEKSQNPAQSL